jgi:hypothetical protein
MTTAPPCGREIKTSHCSAVDHFFSAILITLRALQTQEAHPDLSFLPITATR